MNKHRVVIVGVGSIGQRHLRCFGNTGRAELSICEVNEELRKKVAAEYGVSRTYDQWQAALADPHDAAVIAVPAHLHIPIATGMAEVGLHLLIEKPLSTSMAGIEQLQKTVAENSREVMVAYPFRSHPVSWDLKAALDQQRLGAARLITFLAGQHFPTARPAYRQVYCSRRETGGGTLQDALTHLMNLGEFLLGPIHRIVADCDRLVLEGIEVEDTAHVLTRQGTIMGLYGYNQHQAPNELIVKVMCEHGTARGDLVANRWQSMTEPFGQWQDETAYDLQRDDLFTAQADCFLDVIEGKRRPPCTLTEGIQSLQVNLAAIRSLDTTKWEKV